MSNSSIPQPASAANDSPSETQLTDLEVISKLAKLNIPPGEEENLKQQMANISDMIEQLKEAEIDPDVQPLAHPLGIVQRLRADEVTESPDLRLVSDNKYSVEHRSSNPTDSTCESDEEGGAYFSVPKVLE